MTKAIRVEVHTSLTYAFAIFTVKGKEYAVRSVSSLETKKACTALLKAWGYSPIFFRKGE